MIIKTNMTFKTFLPVLLGLYACIVLTSCGPSAGDIYNEGAKKGFETGFKGGYEKAISDLKNSAIKARSNMNSMMATRLIFYSFVIVFLTLYGSNLSEWLRVKIGETFKIPLNTQVRIIQSTYIVGSIGLMVWCLSKFGAGHSVPIAVFLAGTIMPYTKYLEALKANDLNERKSNSAKLKSLFLFCAVVIIIYMILSEEGFMNIKIG
jgi:hypothetical protein